MLGFISAGSKHRKGDLLSHNPAVMPLITRHIKCMLMISVLFPGSSTVDCIILDGVLHPSLNSIKCRADYLHVKLSVPFTVLLLVVCMAWSVRCGIISQPVTVLIQQTCSLHQCELVQCVN